MRGVLLVVLLAAAPCFAQELPDPGRRLSDDEQQAAPDKQKPEKPHNGPFDPSPKPQRNDRACEGARQNYQFSCKGVGSYAERSQACAEAYAIYRQACP